MEKHSGGAEIEVSLLYVDVRGSTSIAETMSPREYRQGLENYLAVVSSDVDLEQGVIDHMAGDGVMALWIPAFVGNDHPERALRAATRIAEDVAALVEADSGFPAGVGVHSGIAFVGVVGESGSRDFTVLGDTANTTARLSSAASAGEVVLSQAVVDAVDVDTSLLEQRSLELKGKTQPTIAWAWRVGDAAPVPEVSAR